MSGGRRTARTPAPAHHPQARPSQRGVLSLEFALLVLGVLGALMLVAAAWRLGQTRSEVRDVAAEAARAASLRQSPLAAVAAADQHDQRDDRGAAGPEKRTHQHGRRPESAQEQPQQTAESHVAWERP